MKLLKMMTLLLVVLAASPLSFAAEKVRVGAPKFGTVNWELSTIKRYQLDTDNGIDLEIVPFASGSAAKVAFQGGAVDIFVSDYLWVSRQRTEGKDVTIAPYSSSVGALMVPPDSDIRSLSDLGGKNIGIAGGPLDKGWLILRTLSRSRHGADPAQSASPQYGAPPLINKKLEQGELDAALSFWRWCARLEAQGYRRVMPVEEAARELGVTRRVPLLGYVFAESWVTKKPQAIAGFLRASRQAKAILRNDDAAWENLRELTRAKDEATFITFRKRFREGIPTSFGDADIAAAAELYAILANIGGKKLVGDSAVLAAGTFWSGALF